MEWSGLAAKLTDESPTEPLSAELTAQCTKAAEKFLAKAPDWRPPGLRDGAMHNMAGDLEVILRSLLESELLLPTREAARMEVLKSSSLTSWQQWRSTCMLMPQSL